MGRTVASAVVTGAGSGLGRALALELSRRGAAVVVADVDAEGAAETVRQVAAAGGQAFAATCDVCDADAVAALLQAARGHLGEVDLWVNNAGVAAAGEVGQVSLEDWRWGLGVNLWGVVHGCHVAAPYLKQRRRGAILNVASAAGLVSTPGMGPYNVGKAAVVSLSETLYGELRPHGVAVTVLCPTFFVTNLLAEARIGDPAQVRLSERLMREARLQADGVARAAVDDVLAGRLYSVPMADGRALWRLKRLMPQPFHDLYRWVVGRRVAQG